jgi:hypothetical protein
MKSIMISGGPHKRHDHWHPASQGKGSSQHVVECGDMIDEIFPRNRCASATCNEKGGRNAIVYNASSPIRRHAAL